jgi:probable F420-dependent oxidoreductase
MVVPHRQPVLAAKMLSTIDVLSNGRLILGVGAGWMKEEFALLDAPFEARGKATDEYIEAFKALFTQDRAGYQGTHVNFSDVVFEPKPIQKPHPPIWVGGESAPALRRTIQLGDVWYPGNNSQTMPLDTPARLASGMSELARRAASAGRDPASIETALLVQDFFEWSPHRTKDGSARRLYTGSSDDMLADTAALAQTGVKYVAIRLGGSSAKDAVERIERFGSEVISKYRT